MLCRLWLQLLGHYIPSTVSACPKVVCTSQRAWSSSPQLLLLLLQDKMTKNVERELMNHSKLIHPHIVRFYECFLTEKHLAIVMEYAAGGSLYSHVTAK